MKTSSIIVAAAGLLAVALLYGLFDARMDKIENRLATAEKALAPLEPIRRLLANVEPGLRVEGAYGAVQATGSGNVSQQGRDDPRAWCPASRDRGEEWILLRFAEPVEAVTVRVLAPYNPGAVSRLVSVSEDGGEQELWRGDAQAAGAAYTTTYAIAPTSLSQLKLFLDTAKVPGWNEIDAVALLDREGGEHWAVEAEASSSWSGTADTAPAD